MKVFRCKICEQHYLEIPEGSTKLSGSRSGKMYRFPDGQVHDLQVKDSMTRHRQHLRRKLNYSDCEHCNPPMELTNETESAASKEAAVLEEVSQSEGNYETGGRIIVEDGPLSEVESRESEKESPEPFNTTMFRAFRNTRSK